MSSPGALKGHCPKLRKKYINIYAPRSFLCHDSWLMTNGMVLWTRNQTNNKKGKFKALRPWLITSWKSQSHNFETTVPYNREQQGKGGRRGVGSWTTGLLVTRPFISLQNVGVWVIFSRASPSTHAKVSSLVCPFFSWNWPPLPNPPHKRP